VVSTGASIEVYRFAVRQQADARRRATRDGLRMLVATGAALLVASVVVGALSSRGMGRPARMDYGDQWTMTMAGMFGLVAVVFGVAALWQRTRDELNIALRYALSSVVVAIPAVGLHLIIQFGRLSHAPHHRWFTTLVATTGAIRMGFLIAAVIVIADALRTLSAPPSRVNLAATA
jgi:hypothetical protein